MKRPPLFLVLLTLALALLPSCTPPGGGANAKPVIYLYPEAETDVTVTLDYDGAEPPNDRTTASETEEES